MAVLNAAQRAAFASLAHAGAGGTAVRPKRSKGHGVKPRLGAPGDEVNDVYDDEGVEEDEALPAPQEEQPVSSRSAREARLAESVGVKTAELDGAYAYP